MIGLIAGVLVVEAAFFVERRLQIDDPVGAIAVHGVNGAWGCLALGLFADGSYGDGLNGVAGAVRGLFYGDGGQLAAECLGVARQLRLRRRGSFVLFKILDLTVGNRVDRETEIKGLDVPEMGVEAYPGIRHLADGVRPGAAVETGASRARRQEALMKLIIAMIQPHKLPDVKKCLDEAAGAQDDGVQRPRRRASSAATPESYRGVEHETNLRRAPDQRPGQSDGSPS